MRPVFLSHLIIHVDKIIPSAEEERVPQGSVRRPAGALRSATGFMEAVLQLMSGRLYIPRVPQEHNYARGSALWRDLVQRHHYMALPIGF